MDHAKPVIIVTDLDPRLARFEELKFLATLQTDEGDPEEAQGVTPDDAVNNLLTILSLLSWPRDRHAYDIRIK